MIILLTSIFCSISVSILLRQARHYELDIAQAIAVNYGVATVLCLVLLKPHPTALLAPSASWIVLLGLGALLPSIFLVMAAAVQQAGIVRSDAAQRLSLLIPLLAAFVFFGEPLSAVKAGGIVTALIALVLLLTRPGVQQAETGVATGSSASPWTGALLLAGVWAGYGTIDILFKQLAREALDFSSSLLVAFILAGVLMTGWLWAHKARWQRRNLVAGVLLGLLNFGNIYFYIRAHQQFPDNPALVFSAMNIGVIAGASLIGGGLFKERLSALNILGIVLAIMAIVLLIPR